LLIQPFRNHAVKLDPSQQQKMPSSLKKRRVPGR
jgi:hypothetical protein